SHLLSIAETCGLAGRLAGLGEDREQDGGEDRDNGDDDEQFDQRETTRRDLFSHLFVTSFPLALPVTGSSATESKYRQRSAMPDHTALRLPTGTGPPFSMKRKALNRKQRRVGTRKMCEQRRRSTLERRWGLRACYHKSRRSSREMEALRHNRQLCQEGRSL